MNLGCIFQHSIIKSSQVCSRRMWNGADGDVGDGEGM